MCDSQQSHYNIKLSVRVNITNFLLHLICFVSSFGKKVNRENTAKAALKIEEIVLATSLAFGALLAATGE